MEEILIMLVVLLVVSGLLAIVTLVGHGIWVFFAWLLGLRKKKQQRNCVFCNHPTPADHDRCDWCGRDLKSPLAHELADIEAVGRQLQRFRANKQLKTATADKLFEQVKQYRAGLLGPSQPATPETASAAPKQGEAKDVRPAEPVDAPRHPAPPVRKPPSAPTSPKPTAVPRQSTAPKPAPAAPAEPPKPAPVIPQVVASVVPSVETPPTPPSPPSPAPVAPKPKPPAPPRKSFGEMLSAFMEERNMRWGEIVGGLLIIGGATALVISGWGWIEQNIPYFQFLIFGTITAAVFGVGLYSHHRWKLESTSRGILMIATLLVPLNFLAMAKISHDDGSPLTLALEVVSLGVFGYLVSLAGRVLVPGGRWWQAIGVLGSAAGLLLIARHVVAESAGWWFLTAGTLPVVCFAVAIGGYLRDLTKDKSRLDASQAAGLFTMQGAGGFAMIVALGLLVLQAGNLALGLDRLSALVALAAAPILAGGLAVFRGTSHEKSLAGYTTAGTAVSLLGMAAMVAALGLAWPHPLAILVVGTLNAAALAMAALKWRLPVLHAGAIACATLVYLVGFQTVYSDLPLVADAAGFGARMLRATISGPSGTALVGLFAVFAVVSELLARRGLHRHGIFYAGGCGVAAVAGLMLVTRHGLVAGSPDALRAAILYAIYGVGALALVGRWRRVELSYVGLALLAAAPLWLLWWQTAAIRPAWATLLIAEALSMAVLAANLRRYAGLTPESPWKTDLAKLRHGGLTQQYRVPLAQIAEVLAGLAALVAIVCELTAATASHSSPWPVLSAAGLTAFGLLTAWENRGAAWTWIGSIAAAVGLVHTLCCNYADLPIAQPWLVALLSHATVAGVAGVALAVMAKNHRVASQGEAIDRVFSTPLADSALLSSVLATPVFLMNWAATWTFAGCLLWLAAIWLVVAWRRRDAAVFAVHQVAVALAALVATTTWLAQTGRITNTAADLFTPASLQAFGIVLALLTLAWTTARIALRGNRVAEQLLNPPWASVDWCLRHAVVWGQLFLVVLLVTPGIGDELVRVAKLTAVQQNLQLAASGGGAWLLLATSAIGLVVALWDRWRGMELLSALLLAAVVPWLVAGRFGPEIATASALRWGLATAFVVGSLAAWYRKPLLAIAQQFGARIEVSPAGPPVARGALLATTMLPVIGVTVLAAMLKLGGVKSGGPLSDTFFEQLGPGISYILPLLLVLFAMVGHAIRERAAGYAFSAGLVAELMVTLGYALHVTLSGTRVDDVEFFCSLVQLATITAAAWAGAWLLVRRQLNVWRETPTSTSARVLMNVQLAMGIVGNALLIAPALLNLALLHQLGRGWLDYCEAAGTWLGWLALASVAAACVFRRLQIGRGIRPSGVGLLGMTVLGLLACTVQIYWPEWGYRTLMLGWATYALVIVSATWWVATIRTLPGAEGPPQALVRAAAVWVRIAGLAAVALGIKAALWHEAEFELLWAAGAISIASLAGATMAVWRRREAWALAAALGVNLAASLVVCHYHRLFSFDVWWLQLIQANVIASSAVALAWLAVRKQLWQLRESRLGESPLLTLQVALPAVGNVLLLAAPVFRLLTMPAHLPADMARLAEPHGWLALLLSGLAVAWYLRQAAPGSLLHVLGGLGLGAGVLAACHTAGPSPGGEWIEYHTLLTAWATAALAMLLVGYLGRHLRLSPDDDGQSLLPKLTTAPSATGQPVLPGSILQAWATVIGALAVVLAVVYCREDPSGVWWSIRAVVAMAMAAGFIALWRRQPDYVIASGILLNLAGTLGWIAWGPPTWAGFMEVNVLCLAIGSTAWSLLRLAHRDGVPHYEPNGRPMPFSQMAAAVAVSLLIVTVAGSLVRDLLDMPHYAVDRLDWIALAATALALTVGLWDRSFRFTLLGLYSLGLAALGMALCYRDLEPRMIYWSAVCELAGFVFGTAAAGWVLLKTRRLWDNLGIPVEPGHWPTRWFTSAQVIVGTVATALTLWIAGDFRFDGAGEGIALFGLAGRWASIVAALLLLDAAVAMAWQAEGRRRAGWQAASIALGMVFSTCVGWARMDAAIGTPTGDAPWLHRSVGLMIGAAMMTFMSGFGLRKAVIPIRDDWVATGRKVCPVFGTIAAGLLAIVLAQEGYLRHSLGNVPMTTSAVVLVAIALSGIVLGCLAFAVKREWDPLGMSDRGRTLYVYLAELFAALVGLHLWLTVPELFQLGIIERWWMLIVMCVAFLGAGLSELFHRRGMPVLSEPLANTAMALPLLPAVGFWFSPATAARPEVWFVVGLFYGVMAITRRSFLLGLLSAFGANMGLWVLWHRMDIDFTEHPQLWLIPVALAVLVAEYLNRDRLNQAQSTAIRYLALTTVYISSTADMFIAGVGENLWLPLILMLLCVAGVLVGIALRIRAFLWLGVGFLVLDIATMIHYAAFGLGHAFVVLPLCVILLGVAIFVLFALFEKRRNDLLAAMDRLKQWDA